MLQNIFYLTSIISSVLTIAILVVILFLAIKLYRTISKTLQTVGEKTEEIGRVVSEVGDRSADLLHLATKEGQDAIKASTIISAAMNSYFFLKTIFGRRKH